MYTFSKDSYDALKELLTIHNQRNGKFKSRTEFAPFLPKDEALLEALKAHGTQPDASIVIDDDNNDDAILATPPREDILPTIDNQPPPPDAMNNFSDFESTAVLLKKPGVLSVQLLSDLARHHSAEQLETLFGRLENADSNFVCCFGATLLMCQNLEGNIWLDLYCKHLLINKLKVETSEQLTHILHELLAHRPDAVYNTICPLLLEAEYECSFELNENLRNIPINDKQYIFRYFIQHCTALKFVHLSLLESLLIDGIDADTARKLIELLKLLANEHNNHNHNADKQFGKCLYHIVQKLNRTTVRYFEEDLNAIIESHRSAWKHKLRKLFQQLRHADELSMQNLTLY